MPAIPLRGDRSAWDAANYRSLHTNDIDGSASAIHHTLGAGSDQAASGSHIHTLTTLNSGSSIAGEILTSKGSGSLVWSALPNHTHSGSSYGSGGTFDASNLTSGAALAGYTLVADGAGNADWGTPSANITSLGSIPNVYVPAPNNGDVLTWDAPSGSWIAHNPVDWRVTLTQNEDNDDSDKTFTAPDSTEWQILWIWVEYTSTATAGVRQLEIQIQDASSNVIAQFQPGVSQSEGLTYKYLFGIGVADMTSVRDTNYVTTPLPAGTFLSAGQKIRIWDNNAVDASADDMIVRMQYASRSLGELYFNILTINNSTQSITSDKLSLTQHYILAVGNAAQAETSDKVVLGWRLNTLVVQDSSLLQTADNTGLTFHNVPITVNSAQAQSSDNVALTQHHILEIANSTLKISAEKPSLLSITHYPIIIQDTAHSQTSQNTTLTVYAGLIIQDSTQTQTPDMLSLFTDTPVLSVNNSVHSQSSNTLLLFTNLPVLTIHNSVQTESVESVALTQYQASLTVHNTSFKLVTEKVTLYTP